MIKPQELRIGNWVRFPYSGYEQVGDIERIEQDSGTNTEYYISSINDRFPRYYTEIEPIPLTLEILEKCGFEKENEKRDYGLVYFVPETKFIIRRVNFERPILGKDDFSFSLEFSDEKNWCTIINRIPHLHQLQNAIFALTGKELNVKL